MWELLQPGGLTLEGIQWGHKESDTTEHKRNAVKKSIFIPPDKLQLSTEPQPDPSGSSRWFLLFGALSSARHSH